MVVLQENVRFRTHIYPIIGNGLFCYKALIKLGLLSSALSSLVLPCYFLEIIGQLFYARCSCIVLIDFDFVIQAFTYNKLHRKCHLRW